MTQAIGSYSSGSNHAAGSGDVALRGQLARYEKTLAECVACTTADTPEGRQQIQDLSVRIARLREGIALAEQNRSGPAPGADALTTANPGGRIDVHV